LEGKKGAEQLDFGCFCDAHLAAFSKKIGRKVTREEVREAILSQGEPRELAIRYRGFQREVCAEMNRRIEKTIHEVSPETRVALMTSVPDVHAVEGRDWGEFLATLSGDLVPLIRPHFGPYIESDPRIFGDAYLLDIDLKNAVENPGSYADIVLREGDKLIVPEYAATVKISGEVRFPVTVTYHEGKKMNYYIKHAGGYADRAKKNSVYAIYMNGGVKKISKLSSKDIQPGMEIVVPTKNLKKKMSTAEIVTIGSASASIATMIVTIVNLLK
jgi:hypothetical protein